MSNMVAGLLSGIAQWTCPHNWVRARFEDGHYGLRCQYCMKRHERTWNQVMAQPVPRRATLTVFARSRPTPIPTRHARPTSAPAGPLPAVANAEKIAA